LGELAEPPRTKFQYFTTKKNLYQSFFSFSVCSFAQLSLFVHNKKNLQQKILALEHQWVDVALKQNATSFAGMMSDDYVRMNTDGTVGVKKPWVEGIRTGATRYDWVNLFDTNVKLHGNTAIVTGMFT
jgi:hypothetical protein